jgi:hypothetical protein
VALPSQSGYPCFSGSHNVSLFLRKIEYNSVLLIITAYNVGRPIRIVIMIKDLGISGEQKVREAGREGRWRNLRVYAFSTKIGLLRYVQKELS